MATEILRPNAAGTECSIDFEAGCSACPNHYDCVNEASADDDTTRVYTADGGRDLYNLPASSGSGVINHITVYTRCMSGGAGWASCTYRASIRIAGPSVWVGDTEVPSGSGSWETFSHQWTLNPDDDEAWEWADIDALNIGIWLYSPGAPTAAECTQVYVEVDYTPPLVLAEASGSGIGLSEAAGILVKLGLATGSGVGIALASAIRVLIAQAEASGIGIAQAKGDAWFCKSTQIEPSRLEVVRLKSSRLPLCRETRRS